VGTVRSKKLVSLYTTWTCSDFKILGQFILNHPSASIAKLSNQNIWLKARITCNEIVIDF
jgi:hypothetical protein